MTKTTRNQRRSRNTVPYTSTLVVPPTSDELPLAGYQLFGHVCEEKWVATEDGEDGYWKAVWEEIDLGQHATLKDASKVAAEWRTSLVGISGAS